MILAVTADAAQHVTNDLPFKIALIGVLGIGAQWLAWRLQKPAIVLMAIAGLIFGPLIAWVLSTHPPEFLAHALEKFRLDPVHDFGELYRPMIGLAVAIILFEGGLNLNFKNLGDSKNAVLRMVLLASPIAWVLGTFLTHYVVGLSWEVSAMVGGLFVVTGPTVIMPLLRQAHLKSRPANVLKWEGIVNDPVGALFAVGGYEFIRFSQMGASVEFAIFQLVAIAIIGGVIGVISGYGLAWAFRRGLIPEYLKAPIVLAWVLLIYVLANTLASETGLLAVTALGMTMANTKYASMVEMRRFKETIAIILVSGVFVILTATLTGDVLQQMLGNWKIWVFVLGMMIFVRPVAVMLSTLWSGLSWKESLLVSFIAPRGIVAVAVAGLFAAELQHLGIEEGAQFVPLAFMLVFGTVLFAAFGVTPLAKMLGLAAGSGNGVLIVGANPWSLGLARALKEMDIKVLIADTNWRRLRGARLEGHKTFYGEVLSENADYSLDHSDFNHIIAATSNDAYNALVCVEFAPELGRHRVFQVAGQDSSEADEDGIAFTSRGRTLSTRGRSFDSLTRDWWSGWRFRVTRLTDDYTLKDLYKARGDDTDILLALREGSLEILQPGQDARAEGATVLTYCASSDKPGKRGQGAKNADGLAGPASPLPS